VRVVVALQLAVRDVVAGKLFVELLLDQLLDHRALDLLADGGRLVEALPLGFLGEQLVADEALEELLLALDRVVAGAQEGARLVEALLELVGRDGIIADLGDDGAVLAVALASGDGGNGKGRGKRRKA